jgi:hypothetical protein
MLSAQAQNGSLIQRLMTRENAIAFFFTSQMAILIYMQKIALPVGVFQLPLLVPAIYAGFAVMAIMMRLEFSAPRLIVYCLFFGSVVFSQLQVAIPYSQPSMIVTLLMLLPFVFVWRVSRDQYLKLALTYQKLMLIPIAMVGVQLLSQVVMGMGTMPSIEHLIPPILNRQGFNYDGFIRFGDPFRRPNGFFLLEPSFVSAFIGTALVLELTFFRRPFWMALFVAALVGTFGATGQVLTAIALPFVLHRQSPKLIVAGAVAGALGLVVMLATGKGITIDRLGELTSTNTSGYIRLVAPLVQLTDALSRHDVLFTGAGAGNVDHTRSSVWPLTKLIYEYGAVPSLSFIFLMVLSMWRAPAKGLAIALFIVINFVGGYLQEPAVMWLFVLLCCMFQIAEPEDERPRRLAQRDEERRASQAPFQPVMPDAAAAPVQARRVARAQRRLSP